MAILKYNYSFPADIDRLQDAIDFVRSIGANLSFKDKIINDLELVIYEACANIIEHAYDFDKRKLIKLLLFYDYKNFTVVINDYGKSFDLKDIPRIDIENVIEKGQTRGLGLHMIFKVMDDVKYGKTKKFGNVLKMTKLIRPQDIRHGKTGKY